MLFERESHLSELRALLTESRDGKGRMAVVGGPVATGKTELLAAFTEEAARGSVVLSASGAPAERAVPFGVLDQLLRGARLPAGQAGHVARLLRDAAGGDPVPPVVHHELCMAVLDLVERSDEPVVMAVDDAHDSDAPSLEVLTSVVRRARRGVLVVLGDGTGEHPLPAGLPRHPVCRRLRLDPLSREGVTALLTGRLGPRGRGLAERCHDLTGGNPALVQALAEDNRDTPGRAAPEAGAAFRHALLSCLAACDDLLTAACGLAVLAEPRPALLLSKLVEAEPESVSRALAALEECGVLVDGWFRHPAAAAAVLEALTPAERTRLHRRAALLLRTEGSNAAAVARQLVRAGEAVDASLLPVLHEAAEQALAEDDPDHARACLWLARQSGGDERHRAATTAMVARVQWRVDPAAAAAHLDELTAATRAGLLDDRQVDLVVQLLAWFGRSAELPEARPTGGHACMLALTGLLPHGGFDAKSLARAERVLQTSRLEERTLMHTLGALTAQIAGERPADAEAWCRRLLAEVSGRRAPTWHALLAAMRAEIALRRGELEVAERYGRLALDTLPPDGWGVVIGLPVGTLVRAHLAAGRVEDALDRLGTPVPDAMAETGIGLHYMRARGLYYHATGRYRAALDDFHAVGDLMRKWDADVPALSPWRTDAAQTWLRLGNAEQARRLAKEQSDLCEVDAARLIAVSTRIIAATTEPNRRVALLSGAVEALQSTGDRLELATALSDLGWAYHELGSFSQARMALRSAGLIAKQCGAAEPGRTVGAATAPEQPVAPAGADLPPGGALSDAEARVATLASWGYSNRQIANKLFITVSTVEQHLTRAYRKLKVNRRTELANGLYARAAVETI